LAALWAVSAYAVDHVTCQATWYGARYHGRLTASGERFDRMAYTVALNWLPLGTSIRLTYKDHVLFARVNDRMPTGTLGWAVDCSEGIATEMGWREAGRVEMQLEVIQ
jgi:rare lipoprotein A